MFSDDFKKKLYDSRIVVLSGEIDSQTASNIISRLLEYSADDEKKEIQLFIGSEGGSYLDMMAIYDTLKMLPNPLVGVCVGMASNYTTLLLAACTKGMRSALKHSKIYFEQTYGALGAGANQQTEIAIASKEARLEREVFEKALAEVTGQPLERIHEDCEKGMELTADEAKAYGIIDTVLD